MNADSYFENDPWSYTVEKLREGLLGQAAGVCIQATCRPGKIQETLRLWQTRLTALFGPPENSHQLQVEGVISILLRFPGPVIARIFLDEGTSQEVSNFEIAGTRALLVWKPSGCALSTMQTKDKTTTLYEHPFPTALGREVQV
jgi:hypothetical protein